MISVKSKYGSCSGSCTGFINDKQLKFYKVKKYFFFLFYIYINIFYIYLYIKESPVCWYDGLSCKLNDLLIIEGSIPFSPSYR